MNRPPPPMLAERVAHYYGHHGMWNTMVEDYMRCQLTKEEDKLVAIGGVAQFWQMMTIKPDYKAGIWMKELPGALLWHCEPRPETVYSSFRPKEYRAPSFCWASFEGPILFRQGPHDDLVCEVLEMSIENVTDNIFGQVKGGFIRLNGYMVKDIRCPRIIRIVRICISPVKAMGRSGRGCYPGELALLDYDRERGDHKFQCFAITRSLSTKGDHFVSGLMLERVGTGEHGNEYKRVGLFLVGGDKASEFCTTGEQREVVII